eukprot:546467-Prymnesium_polylepis.1
MAGQHHFDERGQSSANHLLRGVNQQEGDEQRAQRTLRPTQLLDVDGAVRLRQPPRASAQDARHGRDTGVQRELESVLRRRRAAAALAAGLQLLRDEHGSGLRADHKLLAVFTARRRKGSTTRHTGRHDRPLRAAGTYPLAS